MATFFSSLATSISDLLPTVYADEKAADESSDDKAEEAPEAEEAPAEAEEEEEEEEEPEDPAPAIREACEAKACKSFKHHFEECAERVSAGNTHIQGENCVEELFHLMHCVDDCAAPKIFATLK